MPWIIAIDAGTTGVRAVATDHAGVTLNASHREFTQHYPRPGWVEHDADEIFEVTQSVLTDAVASIQRAAASGAQSSTTDTEVAAIGITDQRETIVAWDSRTGEPLHNAIVWQDRRTAARCRQLTEQGELPRIRQLTGLVLDPYFSATKIEWLLGPGGVPRNEHLRLGTIDSWLLWKLTGGETHATDVSNAARTMLFDINTLLWSEDLCELFGVPIEALPEVRPSSGTFGHTSAECAAGAGVPIAGIAGDQQSSLFGQACLSPGMAKNTYGTGSFVLMNVGEKRPAPNEALLGTVAWQLPGHMVGSTEATITHYALEGAIFSTGSAVQWLRDGLGIIREASEVGPLARSVSDTGGVIVVPAFNGLGSPWWDPRARGSIFGITRGTTRAHIARAVVESMVHQSRDVVDSMVEVSGVSITELRVDGGAAVMDILCELQADQLGVTVARSRVTETTALGATLLAGLGVGIYSDVEEVSSNWSADRRFEPRLARPEADAAHQRWHRAVERSLQWATEDQLDS